MESRLLKSVHKAGINYTMITNVYSTASSCLCLCPKSLQSRLTFCDSMDCSQPGPSVHGILQARILEWVACPPLEDFPDPEIKPNLLYPLHWQAGSLPLALPGLVVLYRHVCVALNGDLNCISLKYSESLVVVVFSPKLCPTFCDPMDCSMQAPISSTISQCLLKFISIESVMPSNHLILSLLLPSIFPSISVFSN